MHDNLRHELRVLLGKMDLPNAPEKIEKCIGILLGDKPKVSQPAPAPAPEPEPVAKPKPKKNSGDPE